MTTKEPKSTLPSAAGVPPSPRSWLSGLRKSLLSTAILVIFSLPLVGVLLGPSLIIVLLLKYQLLYQQQQSSANRDLWNVIVGTVVAQSMQMGIAYTVLYKPLLNKTARPESSSYPKRYVTIVLMRYCQVFLSLLCSGPLYLFLSVIFCGTRDPTSLSLIQSLRQVIRHLEAKILRLSPPQFHIPASAENRELKIPLRDGVETAATLYSPLKLSSSNDGEYDFDDSPRPVILIRTPYNRESLSPWGARFSERGYHLVAQDTRGRFGSTGEFFPMLHEAEDGAATIEWLSKQAWCNGSVAITGVSYLGLASWAAMRDQVPALKAVAPILAATDMHHVMFGRQATNNDDSNHEGAGECAGAAHVELMFRWSYLVIHLMAKPFGMLESMFTFFCRTGSALQQAYMHAPLNEVDTKYLCPNISEPLEWFHDAFRHPLGTEAFWEGKKKFVDFTTLDKDKIPPVLLFAGWYDFFCSETLHDYQDLSQLSDDCRLVVGPYTHWDVMSMQPQLFRTLVDFFDRHVMKDPCAKDLANVQVFCMGNDMKWHDMKSWPPPNASNKEFTLAQESDGEDENKSSLVMRSIRNECGASKKEESRVEYVYDPADPTPQIGGSTFNPTNCGRIPQNAVEKRNDVLVFTSEPLEEPMTIAGQIRVSIKIVSNVEGTDYVARACHVKPDGVSENISDGIVRRFDLVPGVASRIVIVLSPVMNRLDTGDKLRLHICSCAFPKHGRHLNTSKPFHLAVNTEVSKQQLVLGGDDGSRVTLPILMN